MYHTEPYHSESESAVAGHVGTRIGQNYFFRLRRSKLKNIKYHTQNTSLFSSLINDLKVGHRNCCIKQHKNVGARNEHHITHIEKVG